MESYVYLLRPLRGDLIRTMTAAEEEILGRHFDYLEARLRAGSLVLAGPCLDGAFGIVVFTAPSESDARLAMEGDPAIAEGVMTGELHPFRVSLLQGR